MLYTNKKLGFYKNYYTFLFYSYILPYHNQLSDFYNLNKATNTCLLVYPILYKKIFFLELSSKIIKRKKMKQVYNLNQTLILEGTVSSHKCHFSVPVFSFLNIITLE